MAGTPISLAECIQAGVDASLDNVRKALPGKVTAYDPLTNTAVVKPMVKRALYALETDERVYEELPEIPFVPVVWPRTQAYAVTLPLDVDDHVLLIFTDLSLAEWHESGDLSEPEDSRTHSIGWPIAIPGMYPDVSRLSADPLDVAAREAGMVIGEHGGENRIEIAPSGIKLGASSLEHVMTAEATVLLIYNMFAALAVATAGPWTGAGLALTLADAMTTALGAQSVPAPPGLPAQIAASALLQPAFAAGTPSTTLLVAWVTALAGLLSKTPDASGLFPSAGSSMTKTE